MSDKSYWPASGAIKGGEFASKREGMRERTAMKVEDGKKDDFLTFQLANAQCGTSNKHTTGGKKKPTWQEKGYR